jgi:hypothetical protein
MSELKPDIQEMAQRLSGLFSPLEQVEAVALGGSRCGGSADSHSDFDIYVFTRAAIPLESRRAVVGRFGGASRSDLNLAFWGKCDEWVDAATGLEIDVTYFDAGWMQNRIELVIDKHRPCLGYTTCFWRTVRQSRPLYDRTSWLAALKAKCDSPFPEELRKNIIMFNYPVLKKTIPSYFNQIRLAVQRRDLVSLNHRIAAFFASYFDVLFAFNRILHPGEKRLLRFALGNCKDLPPDFEADVKAVLSTAALPDDILLDRLGTLIDHLNEMLDKDPTMS